jgi:hypothetical protein
MGKNWSYYTVFKRGLAQMKELGPGLLMERYWHRKRILKAKPVECPEDADLEVHVQVCHRDWLNGIWTIMSFAHFGGKPFRLVMLEDGTVPGFAWDHFRRLFPGVVIADRESLRPEVEKLLGSVSPTIVKMWESGEYCTLPKVVDSWILARNKTIVTLDSDVLFFDCPKELLDPSLVEDQIAIYNYINYDGGSRNTHYSHDAEELEHGMGISLPYDFIIGLGRVNLEYFDWELCEKVLANYPPKGPVKHFTIDQSIMGLWASVHGFSHLDKNRYSVTPVKTLGGVVARHYISKTRDLMYVEGIRALRQKTNILRRRNCSLMRALVPKALIPVLSIVKKNLPLWAVKILVDLADRPTGISEQIKNSVSEHGCIFIHIPKCAGNSVQQGLFGDIIFGHQTIRQYEVALSRSAYRDAWKFTVTRNPWKRIASAWRYMKKGGGNERDKVYHKKTLSQYETFDDFVNKWLVHQNLDLCGCAHFKPQMHYISEFGGSVSIDFIARLSNLQDDYSVMREQLGGEELGVYNQTDNEPIDYAELYANKETYDNVAKIYADDIEKLGYSAGLDSGV